MITLEPNAKQLMLEALAVACAEVGLYVGTDEPQNESYARAPVRLADWAVNDKGMAHAALEFLFSGPIGQITGYFVVNGSGKTLFCENFAKPYDFSEFGGRFRVIPAITIS
ncbi:hypothetical protein UFOVP32_70 [uncultured Caudovirales phage]|uniref:Uncharacterized protein n=1 Tax=uncultured Caudovirales phage TaxID=2100421 RepID=A0A6J5KRN4_9CAUD|nr:hypothetical protein UFOVP32_70 [uncultured Caudovirales phage]CAB4123537.1 hypothetical protein UFOVP50_6 [uncultured Caudovirales phage]